MQPPAFRVQQYLRPADLRLIAGVQKEKEDKEEKKVVDDTSRFNEEVLPRVQIVGANNHTTVISRGHTEGASPPKQKSPAHFQSPVGSPPPSATPFNNRPHLTVVTQPQRYQPPATPPFSQSVATQASKAESSPPKATPPCPVAAANRRTYDNAFLDSIAQAHPSLVINKSPTGGAPTICAKLQVKTKKPMMKKAAVVKPMMAEDRCAPAPQPPPSLAPISVTATSASPDHTVVSRVQTIQLTPQKQQQLKQIQAQVQVLSSNKCRSPSEQATLQKLISEQHKILIGGKLIPTIPGQHAQGLAFVRANFIYHSLETKTVAFMGVPPPPSVAPPVESQHHHQPPPPPQQQQPTVIHHQHHQAHHTSTANKATSPIHIQQQVSTQTPVHSAPPQPIFTRAKRASLIEQQMQADRQGAVAPDTDSPFVSKSDAVKRLIRYHTMNEPVLSEKDLAKADEIFEQTAKHLLDKKTHMYNKYTFLILKESMRLQQTSELVLLERLFVADETSRLEQFKQDMTAPVQQSSPPSAQHQHPSLNAGQSSGT
ncbi:hypothetical protein AAG570_004702 [Ranatra chinensis]|uniref:GLTSCR protein conserved domain-containing protein n=1 Tax=Ranatra chinensis TaxID=642074 RepID=A0ABD0Y1L9_9HEMI